jgi:hypothetical protein
MASGFTARFAPRLAVTCAFVLGGCTGDGSDGSGEPATTTMTAPPATDALPTTGVDGDPTGGTDDTGEPAEDPGRVTIHRLNRNEYNNTVRDLLGTSQTPADAFPADDFGLGFDNIADVLSTSPLQAELYERAADGLSPRPWRSRSPSRPSWQIEAETALASVGQQSGDAWNLYSNGEVYRPSRSPTTASTCFARACGASRPAPISRT